MDGLWVGGGRYGVVGGYLVVKYFSSWELWIWKVFLWESEPGEDEEEEEEDSGEEDAGFFNRSDGTGLEVGVGTVKEGEEKDGSRGGTEDVIVVGEEGELEAEEVNESE